MKKRIAIQGFLMFLAILATIFFFKFLLPKRQDGILKAFLDAFGILLVICGFLLRIASRGYKATHSANSQNLVAGGPYALMRNPMYLGTFLIGMGVSLFIFSWWVSLVFGFIFLLIYIPQIKKEEAVLYRRFGDEYNRYRQRTPGFFPNPVNLFKKGIRKYIFLKWQWAKNEIPSLIGVIVLVIAADLWKDIRFFGRIEYQRAALKPLLIIASLFIVGLVFYEKENAPKKF